MRTRPTQALAASRAFSVLPVSLLVLLGTGCGGSGGAHGALAGGSGDTGAPLRTYVTFLRSNGIASVARGDGSFESFFQIINEAEGGMALDYLGNLYQADLRGSDEGAIVVMSQGAGRSFDNELGSLNSGFDREISGFSTTLAEPRSVALAHGPGLVFVADSGDSAVKVFGASAGGDVPPLFTSMTQAAPWDLAYDELADRLYVTLMDGSIDVFDGFVANEPVAPTGSLLPSADGVTPNGVDLRGIALLPHASGVGLVVSDFGLTDGGVDGAIYVFDDVSAADGLVVPDQVLRGATVGLRDPIDLAVSPDGYLRVADPAANRVLVYPSGATRRFLAAPSLTRHVENPRAIAIEPPAPEYDFSAATDLDSPGAPITELVAVTAPAGMNGEVLRLAADLATPPVARFDPGEEIRGLGLDVFGNVYTSFTKMGGTGPEGGVRVMNRLAVARGTGADLAFDASQDRGLEIEGNPFFSVPKPVAPAELDVDERSGLVVFSDPARPGIWSFGMNAGPSANELNVVDIGLALGSAEPRQLDYDYPSDSLYVSISNGTIYVYENVRTTPGDAPDRTITPTNAVGASQITTSLAGLVYDSTRDLLIVSDVGAAAGLGNDGMLLVFDVASSASGLTAPTRIISGASTGLDEPLGLAWDGMALWVADGGNGTVSRFDDFLTLEGDVAPSAALAVPDVISVALRAQGLAPTTGGSIIQ